MTEIYLIAGVRTPIGSFGGSLLPFSAPQLGALAAKAAIQKAKLSSQNIDQVIMGHARQAGCGPNPARQVAFQIGVPLEREAFTVNQACNSSLKAIMLAAEQIQLGKADVVIAGGMESMSNTPYLLPQARFGMRLGHQELTDAMFQDGFFCPLAQMVMGETAENLVERYQISRLEQDEYALRSQQRAERAMEKGFFQEEIIPVELKKGWMKEDEHPRKGVTLEKLSRLKGVFRHPGTIHPGNSSGITDGGAALLVLSKRAWRDLDEESKKVSGKILDFAVTGVDPKVMGIGPVPAVQKVLTQSGISLQEIDLIELNEAFAAQVIACDRELHFNSECLNVNGGAIALGHPIGATGARIVVTLLHELNRRQGRYGLATLCVSGGLGSALLIERV